MRLLLLLMFTAITLFSQAQQANALVHDETGFSILVGCLPMVLVIGACTAAVVYLLGRYNKRDS